MPVQYIESCIVADPVILDNEVSTIIIFRIIYMYVYCLKLTFALKFTLSIFVFGSRTSSGWDKLNEHISSTLLDHSSNARFS